MRWVGSLKMAATTSIAAVAKAPVQLEWQHQRANAGGACGAAQRVSLCRSLTAPGIAAMILSSQPQSGWCSRARWNTRSSNGAPARCGTATFHQYPLLAATAHSPAARERPVPPYRCPSHRAPRRPAQEGATDLTRTVLELNRQGHQIMPLRADDARPRELAHAQLLRRLLRRQQPDAAVDLRRIGVGAADAPFAAQRRC